ncbi:unnamed protein product [Orchesella dallaii]|uniref:Annexin n=1 Tax=Orchesella dallaii TaxID=48710 RepID=A0ABP1QWB7_9HEXA
MHHLTQTRYMRSKAYNQKYAKELAKELEGKLGNKNLGNLMAVMFVFRAVFFLDKDLRSAMIGLRTDEDTLSVIMCCLSAFERKEIRKAYRLRFNTSLVKDIEEHTSSYYETLLLLLTSINYYADAIQRALKEADPDVVLEIVIATNVSAI